MAFSGSQPQRFMLQVALVSRRRGMWASQASQPGQPGPALHLADLAASRLVHHSPPALPSRVVNGTVAAALLQPWGI